MSPVMSRALCIPAVLFLFVAFLLLLIVSVPSSYLTGMDITRAQTNGTVNVIGDVSFSQLRLGIWNYCYTARDGNVVCSPTDHGYSLSLHNSANNTAYIASSWTLGLAVHPVACVVSFIALLLSPWQHIAVTLISSLTSFLAAFLVLIAFIIDIALYAYFKKQMGHLGLSSQTITGPGFWLTFASLILLVLAGFTVCCGRRRTPPIYEYEERQRFGYSQKDRVQKEAQTYPRVIPPPVYQREERQHQERFDYSQRDKSERDTQTYPRAERPPEPQIALEYRPYAVRPREVITARPEPQVALEYRSHHVPPQEKQSKPISHSHERRPHQDQHDEHYMALRAKAIEQGDLMAQGFQRSKEAYARGDHARAKELSEQGKQHERTMESLNAEASAWVFRQNNLDCKPGEIDLHDLHVKEAISYVEKSIQEAQQRGDAEIRFIVGKGIHSVGQVPKIKPAVEDFMNKHNIPTEVDPHNTGVLIAQLA